MSAFSDVNVFTNNHAWRSIFALLLSFILWWLARLISGLFGGLLHRKTTTTTTGTDARYVYHPLTSGTTSGPVVQKSRWHGKTERISEALRDIFISLAAVIFFNYHVNGITRGFEVLVWITLVLGVLWAFGRGLVKRFADGLLLVIIPLFITMWAVGLRSARYIPRQVLINDQ